MSGTTTALQTVGARGEVVHVVAAGNARTTMQRNLSLIHI